MSPSRPSRNKNQRTSTRLTRYCIIIFLLASLAVVAMRSVVKQREGAAHLRTGAPLSSELLLYSGQGWTTPSAPLSFSPALYEINKCPAASTSPTLQPPGPASGNISQPPPTQYSTPSNTNQGLRKFFRLPWRRPVSFYSSDANAATPRLTHQEGTLYDFKVSCHEAPHAEGQRKYDPDVQPYDVYPTKTDRYKRPFPSSVKEFPPGIKVPNLTKLPRGGAIYEEEINGTSAEDIIATTCALGRSLSDCNSVGAACVFPLIGDLDVQTFVRHSMYDLQRTLRLIVRFGLIYKPFRNGYEYFSSKILPNSGGQAQHTLVESIDNPVYPMAPQGGHKIPIWYFLHLWRLSDDDVAKLLDKGLEEGVGTLYVKLAEFALKDIERHELGHLIIMERFRENYFKVINEPYQYGGRFVPRFTTDLASWRLEIPRKLAESWNAFAREERSLHTDHEDRERNNGHRKAMKNVFGVSIECDGKVLDDFIASHKPDDFLVDDPP